MLATIRPSPALCRLSLQPVKLTQSSYSTTASPSHDQRRAARRPKLSHSSPSSASTTTTVVDLRAASTSSPSSTSNSTSSSAAPPDHLDWNTFFALRKTRRRYALASSVLTSASTTMAGISILSQQDIDAIGTQVFGLDPIVVLGLATAGFGAVGWLLGPVFGNAAFNLVNQRYRAQIAKVGRRNIQKSCDRRCTNVTGNDRKRKPSSRG